MIEILGLSTLLFFQHLGKEECVSLKSQIYRFAKQNGFIEEKTTNKQDLALFLTSLKPVSTDKPLVRIGESNDGGYLLPKDFEDIGAVYSPGVAEYAKFEEYFADMGIPCFLADYSVDEPPIKNKNFFFTKKYLGRKNTSIDMTLKTWIHANKQVDSDFILQMDIEAAEWNVLPKTPRKTLQKFRIMIIEFHDLPDVLFKNRSFLMAKRLFEKIQKDFYVVHIHQNNCCGQESLHDYKVPRLAEFTFIRKDRVQVLGAKKSLLDPLDMPNVPEKAELPPPHYWD